MQKDLKEGREGANADNSKSNLVDAHSLPTHIDTSAIVPHEREKNVVERVNAIFRLFNGNNKFGDIAKLRSLKLSARDKAKIIHDKRFISVIDAFLFDAFFGLRIPTEQQLIIAKMIMKRIKMDDESDSKKSTNEYINNKNVISKITINQPGTMQAPDKLTNAIDVTPQG